MVRWFTECVISPLPDMPSTLTENIRQRTGLNQRFGKTRTDWQIRPTRREPLACSDHPAGAGTPACCAPWSPAAGNSRSPSDIWQAHYNDSTATPTLRRGPGRSRHRTTPLDRCSLRRLLPRRLGPTARRRARDPRHPPARTADTPPMAVWVESPFELCSPGASLGLSRFHAACPPGELRRPRCAAGHR